MRIELAEHAGYCYGVERALKLARQAARAYPKPIYTLGPIIHNPQVVKSLEEQGIYPASNLNEIRKGTMIIRSHGVDPQIITGAEKKGIHIVDATCPFVKKAQQRASKLVREGYELVIVGERDHPEVIGILAHAGGKALVAEKLSDLESLKGKKKIGVVVQTTQPEENLKLVVGELLTRATEIKVFNTICDATIKRQAVARELAKRVDIMLIVGGKNSANTSRLAQICRQTNPQTHHIETAKELNPAWFETNSHVGVTAGASTPDWILREVVDRLSQISQ